MSYKKTFTLVMRTKESEDIKDKNPNSIPVICEKAPHSKIKEIDKTKFLIKKNLTLQQFKSIIRKKLNLNDTDALFLLVRKKYALVENETFEQIYNKYKDEDGFLYIYYASEEVWGH